MVQFAFNSLGAVGLPENGAVLHKGSIASVGAVAEEREEIGSVEFVAGMRTSVGCTLNGQDRTMQRGAIELYRDMCGA
jgi:hypothetical protein